MSGSESGQESRLPSKLFFRIGEVAGLVGVEPHVLRYWEREFRSIRPTKSAKGQRVYSRKDVENLLRVRDLVYRDGFTIAGAKKRLQRGAIEPQTPVALALVVDESRADLEPASEREIPPEASGSEPESAAAPLESAAQPESGARPQQLDEGTAVREKLAVLRAEVEAFLFELEGEPGELA